MRVFLLLAVLSCLLLSVESRRHPHSPRHRRTDYEDDRFGASNDTCNGADWGVAGKFDVYVLAQSWSAEFCYSHASYPGCKEPTTFMKNNLTMHGLWPQYNKSTGGHNWPQCCTQEPLQQATITQYLTDLQLMWPNEQAPNGKPLASSLWAHEWSKHGTCTGLKQTDFFALALRLGHAMTTPDIISQSIGGFLTEVHTCFSISQSINRLDLSQMPEQSINRLFSQVECPANVGSDSSICKTATVKISAFK